MMKSFFSSIAREALARENIPEGELRLTEHQQSSAATSDTREQFSIYPTLSNDISDTGYGGREPIRSDDAENGAK